MPPSSYMAMPTSSFTDVSRPDAGIQPRGPSPTRDGSDVPPPAAREPPYPAYGSVRARSTGHGALQPLKPLKPSVRRAAGTRVPGDRSFTDRPVYARVRP